MSAAVAALPSTMPSNPLSSQHPPSTAGGTYRLDMMPPASAIPTTTTTTSSSPASSSSQDSLLRLTPDQVVIQSRLGSGAFSSVFAVELTPTAAESLQNHHKKNKASQNQKHEQNMTKNGYAIKRLRADVLMHSSKQVAMTDFLSEMKILSTLPYHNHIVQLHSLSQDFEAHPDQGFLILEKLQETLQARFARWEMRSRYLFKFNKVSMWNIKARKALELEEQTFRIKVAALGVAKALEHLHSNGILYRDIKPSNIGFATDGSVKVFDFGMARRCNEKDGVQQQQKQQQQKPVQAPPKEIKTIAKDQHHLYVGTAGTARYMAPEVAMNQPYGFPADVHSFGILLWQICSLQTPYKQVTSLDAWFKTCVLQQRRPNLRFIASPKIQELTQACWAPNPEERPTFASISKELEQQVNVSKTASK